MPGLRNRFGSRRAVRDRAVVSGGPRRGRGRGGALALLRALAGLVRLVTALVVAVIVVGILLVVLKANPANDIVDALRNAAKYLSKPFDAIFEMKKRRTEIAINWGIAAVVYGAAGGVVARLLRRGG